MKWNDSLNAGTNCIDAICQGLSEGLAPGKPPQGPTAIWSTHFSPTIQAIHVAFAGCADKFAGFAICQGFFVAQPLAKCCTILLFLTTQESFLIHTFCHGFCEGLPLATLPGVFPGIAPGKFARTTCSWHCSLAICKISCSEQVLVRVHV
jgi:hypothetical protein